MKKIINGQVCDTATAQILGNWENVHYGDLDFISESLYRKRTGEFFLYGEGGPRSKYAERVGNSGWTDGERIMPLTWDEAREWAEEKLSPDEYQQVFGEVAVDDSKAYLNAYIPTSCIEYAKRAAAKQGINLSAYIESPISKEMG